MIETCARIPSRELATLSDRVLVTDGYFGRLWPLVERSSILPWFRDLFETERQATEIKSYESYFIPGLLQTEDYARATASAVRPMLADEAINQIVALRMTRQEILNGENGPRAWFVLDESVLRREVGSAQTLRKQLMHLRSVSRKPSIVIQVVPESAGATAALGRSFVLLSFQSKPAIVYLEDVESARYIREPDDVSRYSLVFDHVRASALPDDKTLEIIERYIDGQP